MTPRRETDFVPSFPSPDACNVVAHPKPSQLGRWSDRTITKLRKIEPPQSHDPPQNTGLPPRSPRPRKSPCNTLHAALPALRISLPQTDKTITKLRKIAPPQSHDPPQNTGNPSLWASWKKILSSGAISRSPRRTPAPRQPNTTERIRTGSNVSAESASQSNRTEPNTAERFERPSCCAASTNQALNCLRGSWS